jgi:hypothetical protein
MINRIRIAGALAIAATALLAAAAASAGIVTYTLSGQLDGSIGGATLAARPFTWTLSANNLGSTTLLGGFPALAGISSSITLDGLGSAALLQPTYVFQSTADAQFAFVDKVVANGAGWLAPAFATDVLGAAFGPQAASFSGAIGDLGTSLGALQITDLTGLSFSATVAPTPPVLYTLSGLVTGSLNGVAFNDAPLNWSIAAGTTQAVPYFGIPALAAISDQIHLGGFGDLTPTLPFIVATNPGGEAAGFADTTGQQGVILGSNFFDTYVLGDPLSGLAPGNVFFTPVQTSGGLLDISAATNLVLNASILTGVPEPSTWALLIVGFGGVGSLLRRRRAAYARSIRTA